MKFPWLAAAWIAAAPLALAQTVAEPDQAPVAAPGIRLDADGTNEAPQPRLLLDEIEPANALEHAFMAALGNPEYRPIFRRQLLDQNVALVLASPAPDATPLEADRGDGRNAAFLFTSSERVDQVMGPQTPRQVMTGRAALERLRGKNVVLNARLIPMLTLEPEDVASYLSAPVPRASTGPAQ